MRKELIALRDEATVDVVTAGSLFGIARDTAYKLAKANEFPTPVIKVGAKYRVPVAELFKTLGVDPRDLPDVA